MRNSTVTGSVQSVIGYSVFLISSPGTMPAV